MTRRKDVDEQEFIRLYQSDLKMTTICRRLRISRTTGKLLRRRLGLEPRPPWRPSILRERLPDRRNCWTQKVKIEGRTFYLNFGEYDDGRVGEIWFEAHTEGTFLRGILGALARMVSLSLQCGVPVSEVVHTLREMNFPPNGEVCSDGLSPVMVCSSLVDWIAREMEYAYDDNGRRRHEGGGEQGDV